MKSKNTPAHGLPKVITAANVESAIASYSQLACNLGSNLRNMTGVALLRELKRNASGTGPYPNVSLFEAANRVMTDLVMLHGVRWLLQSGVFEFDAYSVEHGHGNEGEHDVVASKDGRALIGEVFNVAPSFFPTKRSTSLPKLRASAVHASYRLLLVNSDAMSSEPSLTWLRDNEFLLLVDVDTGNCRLLPESDRSAGAASPRMPDAA